MGLNIKNAEVERLATEVAKAMGVSKTEAIRQALADKSKILGVGRKEKGHEEFHAFLEDMWKRYPMIRETRITKEDYDAIYE
ncbi:MAG: type II toxin-antitoxin system VapB family antitoxin [Armatimonadetes bacterium]|nr:type II toxin-antitoxin system VapB family antitoxin [Armatimonadota bacterium]